MVNRNNILYSIKENIGSGKINIIFTPKGVNSESFILKDIKGFIEKNFEDGIIFYSTAESSRIDMDLFSTIVSSNKKVFVLLNDLSLFKDPLSIINIFYGNKNINVIATTSVHIKRLAGSDMTDIRGRYISFFYPPFLFGDEVDMDKSTIKGMIENNFSDYKHKIIAKNIYQYLLPRVGQILSFRDIYSNCGNSVSLVTFVDIINYLHDAGLFYILPRVEIDDFEEMDYGYSFYPTRCFDVLSKEVEIDDYQRQKIYFDSLLVAKAFYDNQLIYRAYHTKRAGVDGKRINVQLSNCFLVKKNNQYVLLKTNYYQDNDRSMQMYLKYKGNIQKIIVSNGDMNFHIDESGIVRCGIKYILEKGIFSYGGI